MWKKGGSMTIDWSETRRYPEIYTLNWITVIDEIIHGDKRFTHCYNINEPEFTKIILSADDETGRYDLGYVSGRIDGVGYESHSLRGVKELSITYEKFAQEGKPLKLKKIEETLTKKFEKMD